MIKGLDEAAKRAEKLEAREEAKRKGGGKMNANAALHVDDTGRRWARMTNLVIIVTILTVIGVGGFLMYSANVKAIDPRVGNADARQMLSQLVGFASRIKKFGDGETATAEAVKQRILEKIDSDISNINEQIENDKKRKAKGGKYESPRGMATKDRDALTTLRKLQDPWGQPIDFSMADADTLKISAVGKKAPGTEPPDPVTVSIRANASSKKSNEPDKAAKSEKTEKTEK